MKQLAKPNKKPNLAVSKPFNSSQTTVIAAPPHTCLPDLHRINIPVFLLGRKWESDKHDTDPELPRRCGPSGVDGGRERAQTHQRFSMFLTLAAISDQLS